MNLKLPFYFLILISLITGIPSCHNFTDSCDGVPPMPAKRNKVIDFKIEGLKHLTVLGEIEYNGLPVTAKDSLTIQLAPITNLVYAKAENETSHGFFINSAIACSPAIYATDQQIRSLNILSTTDFDNDHKAGKNLADLLVVRDLYNQKNTPLSDYLKNDSIAFLSNSTKLTFSQNPTQPGSHVLTFILELNDTTFHFKTPAFQLK